MTLYLDLAAQKKLHELVTQAAVNPHSEEMVQQYIAQARRGQPLSLDFSRCAAIEEGYLVSFSLENAPGLGLSRHLVVGRTKFAPERVALAMLLREVGMARPLFYWRQPIRGAGTAIHAVEPVTLANASDLPIEAALLILGDDILAPAPDDEIEADE